MVQENFDGVAIEKQQLKLHSTQRRNSTTADSESMKSILNVMAKQTVLVTFHVLSYFFILIVPLIFLNVENSYWVGAILHFVQSTIIFNVSFCK